MKCPHCGFENSDYTYRCVKCSNDLANAHTRQPKPAQKPQNTGQQQSNQKQWTSLSSKHTQKNTRTTYTGKQSNQNFNSIFDIFKSSSTDIKTYLIPNIIATMMCCMPVGIIGIFYSTHVQHHLNSGNIDEARKASERARLFMIIAYSSGIIFGNFYLFLQFLNIWGAFQ